MRCSRSRVSRVLFAPYSAVRLLGEKAFHACQRWIDDKDLLFREIDLMTRQVVQLLHLAEVNESQNFNFGAVSSVDVTQDVVSYLERKADRYQVTLQIEADADHRDLHTIPAHAL